MSWWLRSNHSKISGAFWPSRDISSLPLGETLQGSQNQWEATCVSGWSRSTQSYVRYFDGDGSMLIPHSFVSQPRGNRKPAKELQVGYWLRGSRDDISISLHQCFNWFQYRFYLPGYSCQRIATRKPIQGFRGIPRWHPPVRIQKGLNIDLTSAEPQDRDTRST